MLNFLQNISVVPILPFTFKNFTFIISIYSFVLNKYLKTIVLTVSVTLSDSQGQNCSFVY